MIKIFSIVSCVILFSLQGIAASKVTVRFDQFKQLEQKMINGKNINVVFFGGSITNGAKANRGKSYRELVGKWLQDTYPKATFNLMNRGIGGTGSLLGAYRFDDHVLKPVADLLFVEFAVNDMGHGTPSLKDPYADMSSYRTLSGIIKRARKANPNMAIVMPITTMRKKNIHQKWRDSRTVFTTFASMEHIPYVDMYKACYEEPLPTGVTEDEIFTGPDNAGNAVHPDDGGHKVYAEAINKTLANLFERGDFEFEKVVKKTYADYPVAPKLYTANDFDSTETWIVQKAQSRFPAVDGRNILIGTADSKPISFKFKGTPNVIWASILDDNKDASGRFRILVDGKPVMKFYAGNKNKKAGYRKLNRWSLIKSGDKGPNAERTLTLQIDEGQKKVYLPILGIGIDEGAAE